MCELTHSQLLVRCGTGNLANKRNALNFGVFVGTKLAHQSHRVMAGRTGFDIDGIREDSSDEENEDVWDAHQVPLPAAILVPRATLAPLVCAPLSPRPSPRPSHSCLQIVSGLFLGGIGCLGVCEL